MEATRKTAEVDVLPAAVPERYEDIVNRLNQLVDRLEGGGLSLEEAITAFEQGIRLARAGTARLDAAEKRIEMLLENDKTVPFEPSRPETPPNRTNGQAPVRPKRAGDDIPF